MSHPTTTHKRMLPSILIGATAIALTACAGSSPAVGAAPAAAPGGVDLAASGCPDTVVIQTNWNPEAEHGHLYQLLGPDPVIDAAAKSITGALYAHGEPTGVNVEIRAGGPAIGFQTVSSQMYSDPSITLGYVTTDEAIAASADRPTTAVFADMEKSPLMVMWDPATYPDVTTIADIGRSGATVRYFGGSVSMEYLLGSGILNRDQVDPSYDGSPAAFVADAGRAGQQGFASAEPYYYEHEVQQWMKPVSFQLMADVGYSVYDQAVSVRTGDLDTLSGCLSALVPVLQRAEVDYFAAPSATNDVIFDIVDAYGGVPYSPGLAAYSVATMLDLGLVGNGDNATLGDFDDDRMADIVTKIAPIHTALGVTPKAGLVAADLYTNDFIDSTIGLP